MVKTHLVFDRKIDEMAPNLILSVRIFGFQRLKNDCQINAVFPQHYPGLRNTPNPWLLVEDNTRLPYIDLTLDLGNLQLEVYMCLHV